MEITIISIVRLINFLLAISVSILWITTYKKCKSIGLIAPITWILNVSFFYIYRFYLFLNPAAENTYFLNLWVSVIMLHGILLSLFSAWAFQVRNCSFNKEKEKG